MQDENRQSAAGTAGEESGRSAVGRLPSALREAVDSAIADGATIDEITALIRENGGDCSRAAVGRYAKRTRNLIQRQHEPGRIAKTLGRMADERGEDRTDLVLVETLRTLALLCLADLGEREEPVSTEELSRLALILRRIEGTDKLRSERERAMAKAARAGAARRQGGLSPETTAAIREAVEGKGWR